MREWLFQLNFFHRKNAKKRKYLLWIGVGYMMGHLLTLKVRVGLVPNFQLDA